MCRSKGKRRPAEANRDGNEIINSHHGRRSKSQQFWRGRLRELLLFIHIQRFTVTLDSHSCDKSPRRIFSHKSLDYEFYVNLFQMFFFHKNASGFDAGMKSLPELSLNAFHRVNIQPMIFDA